MPLVQSLADNKLGRTITYNYSPLDQIASTSSSPAGYTYSYGYDNAGNITHNSGLGKYYKYNAANEICAIAATAPTACGTIAGAGTPAYDADGDLTGDGASPTPTTFAYDARDQLDTVTPGAAAPYRSPTTAQARSTWPASTTRKSMRTSSASAPPAAARPTTPWTPAARCSPNATPLARPAPRNMCCRTRLGPSPR